MKKSSFVLFSLVLVLLAYEANGLIPYSKSILDMLLPSDDPFKILEQSPLAIPKGVETLALARADWLETDQAHVISLDIPGMKKVDIKIEVEENNVLRISGERVSEEEKEGDKWHRVERTSGRFWRQFRLPSNADLESVKAHLENGVLKITVPKKAEVKKQAKVVDIVEKASNDDVKSIKSSKDEM